MIMGLYRLALRAFPKRHRDLYQAEMVDAFQRELEARRGLGAIAVARFVVAAGLDAIVTGFAERRRWHVVRFGYAVSSLDFTLAWRMIRRFPGLSIVSVFGMAVGIAVATTAFTVVAMLMDTRLPLPQGERIVSIVSFDASTSTRELRLAHDYAAWREMSSMADVGISRQVTRTLLIEGRAPEAITLVEISSSAFRVAGVSALRGRYLLPEDEAPGAAEAVVIGYDEWARRFGADPDIIGRSLQLGSSTYHIVGVMPEDFAFPANYTFWIPWRVDAATFQPRTGPRVGVFGRLAAGATLESAQAELTEIGRRAAADSPSTHQHLRPKVMPYVYAFTDMGEPENFLAMRAIQIALVLLLIVVCVNVAILVYARTATREGEIAVRTALGASRLRIVGQLFVEALTLASVAAAIGVFLVSVALPLLEADFLSIVGGRMPFWLDFHLSADSASSVIAFTLLAAGIVGVLPALKATNKKVQTRLQTLAPGSGSRMQMGRLWTLLIVAQVAMTVALLPAAMFVTWEGLRLRTGNPGFASQEFVSASLAMDRSLQSPTSASDDAFKARFAAAQRELDDRLRAEAQVADVTFSLVDAGNELAMALEAEGQPLPANPVQYGIQDGSKAGHLVRYNRVATNFFDAFDVPVILGRDFSPADLATDRVIISRTLAQMAFGTTNPLGGRIKYVGRSREAYVDDDYMNRLASIPPTIPLEHWYEVIGVVPDFFPTNLTDPERRVYHPVAVGEVYPPRIGVRIRAGNPALFADTLRQAAAAVSLDLQVRDITTTEILAKREQGLFRLMGVTVGLVMLSVITLSAAGIYSLMSFTVARRRREIGIRAALGADRRHLLLGIFARALGQLGVGAFIGILGAIGLEQLLESDMLQSRGAILLPLVALIMSGVGALSTIGPALEGLRIQPTEALREE
jgi:putative ABC transport system permease protein